MSRENVEILEQMFDAVTREELTTVAQTFDPEIRVFPLPDELGARDVYEGLAGLEEYLANWFSTWENYRAEPVEFVDANDEVVVVLREWGRMAGSEIEVVEEFSHSFKLRDGRIVEWRMHESRAGALKAVGLPS